ncbi:septal ring lytic transglycosylase RlpA family protein [Azonexus sp. IMCC34839]|uniref:septal ring lytic transglycosylase RlpA family protein n=1 Tax=Azonexus sp. IMCC34839 TaxID=3133695 RepID=UPI00399A2D40
MKWAAAILAGSLLWLTAPLVPEAGAATRKPAVAGKTAHAVARKAPAKKKAPAAEASSEVFVAEVDDAEDFGLRGHASFYGHGFQGRKTSTGERFNVRDFTAASNHFPLGSWVAVRRLDSDRCAIVKVNDRMHTKHRKRIIDVSRGVAEYLGMLRAGVVLVRVAALKKAVGEKDLAACHAAFEADNECDSCGALPKIPEFGSRIE